MYLTNSYCITDILSHTQSVRYLCGEFSTLHEANGQQDLDDDVRINRCQRRNSPVLSQVQPQRGLGTSASMALCLTEFHCTPSFSLSLSLPQMGTRVGIMRVPEFNGSLLIFIDGAPIGIIATGVPEKVYGFVELQGDCEKVCLSPVRSIQQVSESFSLVMQY